MSITEERAHTICVVTKVPFEHQIITVSQVIVHLAQRKSEQSESLWLPTDKAMERSNLATPSVKEFQEVESNFADLLCIPDESTMETNTVLEVGPVPPP